jgi:hypothetical protein
LLDWLTKRAEEAGDKDVGATEDKHIFDALQQLSGRCEIKNQEVVENSLRFLCRLLYEFHGDRLVTVLVDDWAEPLVKLHLNRAGYLAETRFVLNR